MLPRIFNVLVFSGDTSSSASASSQNHSAFARSVVQNKGQGREFANYVRHCAFTSWIEPQGSSNEDDNTDEFNDSDGDSEDDSNGDCYNELEYDEFFGASSSSSKVNRRDEATDHDMHSLAWASRAFLKIYFGSLRHMKNLTSLSLFDTPLMIPSFLHTIGSLSQGLESLTVHECAFLPDSPNEKVSDWTKHRRQFTKLSDSSLKLKKLVLTTDNEPKDDENFAMMNLLSESISHSHLVHLTTCFTGSIMNILATPLIPALPLRHLDLRYTKDVQITARFFKRLPNLRSLSLPFSKPDVFDDLDLSPAPETDGPSMLPHLTHLECDEYLLERFVPGRPLTSIRILSYSDTNVLAILNQSSKNIKRVMVPFDARVTRALMSVNVMGTLKCLESFTVDSTFSDHTDPPARSILPDPGIFLFWRNLPRVFLFKTDTSPPCRTPYDLPQRTHGENDYLFPAHLTYQYSLISGLSETSPRMEMVVVNDCIRWTRGVEVDEGSGPGGGSGRTKKVWKWHVQVDEQLEKEIVAEYVEGRILHLLEFDYDGTWEKAMERYKIRHPEFSD
ncbi:hypothetical protein CC1G_05543 [Coprinopsis cinerea okayama7|uniref:Uncharacterized protein n=1 Tax=Coprinopsis cinerea (strain Okayama-7 / 130 / ATCC MYA-4618 / FGSC 9003) TaxID=240176 RepID=A8P5N8_COPC7|nr:hypothetical protein CC1G_05543 [Coprinopsis cinerea okayama7\|eukprot:XP_001838990.2 hypothetical protein CC1G_05543 [Coprinopsis cinerea okayama7\